MRTKMAILPFIGNLGGLGNLAIFKMATLPYVCCCFYWKVSKTAKNLGLTRAHARSKCRA
jgi:hypothetical protein